MTLTTYNAIIQKEGPVRNSHLIAVGTISVLQFFDISLRASGFNCLSLEEVLSTFKAG